MKKLFVILLAILLVGILGFLVFMWISLSNVPCSFNKQEAKIKIEKYLNGKSLPLKYLVFDQGSKKKCMYSYTYEGEGEKIDFIVIDDFVRGPKLTWWNYNKRRD